MLVTTHMWGPQLLMGHREPTELSVIEITCNSQYPDIRRIQEKRNHVHAQWARARSALIKTHRQGVSATYASRKTRWCINRRFRWCVGSSPASPIPHCMVGVTDTLDYRNMRNCANGTIISIFCLSCFVGFLLQFMFFHNPRLKSQPVRSSRNRTWWSIRYLISVCMAHTVSCYKRNQSWVEYSELVPTKMEDSLRWGSSPSTCVFWV